MVFECPAVQHIRDCHSNLFWDGQSMRELVKHTDQQPDLMKFSVGCLDSFIQTD